MAFIDVSRRRCAISGAEDIALSFPLRIADGRCHIKCNQPNFSNRPAGEVVEIPCLSICGYRQIPLNRSQCDNACGRASTDFASCRRTLWGKIHSQAIRSCFDGVANVGGVHDTDTWTRLISICKTSLRAPARFASIDPGCQWFRIEDRRLLSPYCHRAFVLSVSEGSSPKCRRYSDAKRPNSQMPFAARTRLTVVSSASAARSSL